MSEQPEPEKSKSFDELLQEADSGDLITEQEDTTANLAMFPDDPPTSGEWVDVHEILENPTEEEMEEGRRLGETIKISDDNDNGGV